MHPKIICHMMTTVDGKIAENRWSQPFDGMDIDQMTMPYYDISAKFDVDAEMLGRKTVHIHHMPEEFDATGLSATQNPVVFIGNRESKRSFIVLDPRGRIRYTQDRIGDANIITILSERVSDAYLQHLRQVGISYVFAGVDGHDLATAMNCLYETFHIKKIVLEGGGIVNGAFLKAGLIDTLSLIIYPGIDGLKGAASLFDYAAGDDSLPAEGQMLELTHMENIGHGLVWLRYKFHR
ncbi:dihydrofolate reductase family protein [Bartonella sp. LJL80]